MKDMGGGKGSPRAEGLFGGRLVEQEAGRGQEMPSGAGWTPAAVSSAYGARDSLCPASRLCPPGQLHLFTTGR